MNVSILKKSVSQLVVLGLALLPFTAFSGAWVHDPHKYYIETSFGWYRASNLFDQSGNKIPNEVELYPGGLSGGSTPSTYKQFDANLYIEYGIGFDTEVNLNTPLFLDAKQSTAIGDYGASGFGDIILGIKHNVINLPQIVASAELVLGIPSGDEDSRTNSIGSFPRQRLPLGDGEYDAAIVLHASRGFQKLPLFVSTSLGYRFRDLNNTPTDFADDMSFGFDVGYTFPLLREKSYFNHLVIFYATRGLYSFAPDINQNDFSLILTGNTPGQSFIDLQPGLMLNLWKKLALTSSYSYTAWGENTGAGWSYRAGLAWVN